ncbi:MAG TPA: hypothetical protein VJU80_09035 [Solirubrobacteraceae bacterium]|nr:hypothetical protein [Solirubrobacteraceae bacterium]
MTSAGREGITTDRRELWRLEGFLAVNGTTEAHRERRLRLYRYLCDTCEHEWSDVSGWGGSPKGTRQCSWCNVVLAPGERLAPASTEPLPLENTHRIWQERFPARIIPPGARP